MTYVSKNTRILAAGLAVCLTLASSGFTTVLRQCNMEVATCCENPKKDDHCDGMDAVQTKLLAQSEVSCHQTKVIGGFTTNQALLEKDAKLDLRKVSVAPVLFPAALFDQINHSHPSLSSPVKCAPLPSAEKYVLNASFLI